MKGVKVMKKKWINVTSKWSYLCFIPVIIGLFKIALYDISLSADILMMGKEIMISLLLVIIGIYLFVRMNSYSHLFNPDHPH